MRRSARRGLMLGSIGWACAVVALAAGHWNPVGPRRSDGTPVPIVALAFVPESATLFAGADEGAFRSDDGGAHWVLLDGALSDSRGVLSLAVDPHTPSTVYAGTYAGLYKSIDSGESWTATWTDEVVYALAVDPAAPSILYAATGPMDSDGTSGFFKSVDGGESWARFLHTDDYDGFVSVAIDPTDTANVYTGTYLGRFFSTSDGGTGWSEASGQWDGRIQSIALDPLSPSTLYAASYQTVVPIGPGLCNVVKSVDSGRSFSELSGLPGTGVSAVAVNPNLPFHVVAGVDGAVYESADGGATWAPITEDPFRIYASAVVFDPLRPRHLYAVANGVYEIELGSNRSPVDPPAATRQLTRELPRR